MPGFFHSAETSGIETMFHGKPPPPSSEFCGRLSRGLKAHFLFNKINEYHCIIYCIPSIHNDISCSTC